MAAELAPRIHFTEAEYWALEENSEARHEYYDGQIYLMSGGSLNHADILLNVSSSLKVQLRGRPCRVRGSELRLKVGVTGLNTYPDVSVACPPFKFDPGQSDTLLDAVVLVEVLSPSTEHYDRTIKFNHYKQLPSLRHYLLVDQDRIFVEHRFFAEDDWETRICNEKSDVIELPEIGCRLTLDEIYDEVL